MYAVQRGDPRPKKADFADPAEFQTAFRAWCRIHAFASRAILYIRTPNQIGYDELRKRLGIDDGTD